MKTRSIGKYIKKDLQKKFVLLSGPRQVGKTTLARSLEKNTTYLNYDDVDNRLMIRKKEWPKSSDLVVLDELHKMKNWEQFLKGVYDLNGTNPQIIITGSARLDIAKKMGDSLAGRFRAWRLHPLCLKELLSIGESPQKAFYKLLNLSGFPEPYFANDLKEYRRWSTTHLDIIVRQDVINLSAISDLASLETLVQLISERVGSIVSYESLARVLDRDAGTIKRWLTLLENLFIIFKVPTWSKNISKALKKSAKYYLFDTSRVANGDAAKFENLIACALLKELHRLHDQEGIKGNLWVLRDRDGHELDFLVDIMNKPKLIIEAKWSDDQFSPSFKLFSKYFDLENTKTIQLVAETKHEKESKFGTRLLKAPEWLSKLNFL